MECKSNNFTRAVGVVLLAAGRSRRMGRPKLLLPWGGTSVIGHQIRVWTELGAAQIVVVCAADDGAMGGELDRLEFSPENRIVNESPERGMFSSIRCAAQWTGWNTGWAHWAISLGDQPHLQTSTLQALLAHAQQCPDKISQPRWQERLCHPVVVPRTVFQQLRESRAPTFKDFLEARLKDISGCSIDDAGLAFDIDTADDYEKLRPPV